LKSSKPDPVQPAIEINTAVGSELSALISRAMAQNPDERFASATEFREALRCIGRADSENSESDFCLTCTRDVALRAHRELSY